LIVTYMFSELAKPLFFPDFTQFSLPIGSKFD
jgi:hypothetical protein